MCNPKRSNGNLKRILGESTYWTHESLVFCCTRLTARAIGLVEVLSSPAANSSHNREWTKHDNFGTDNCIVQKCIPGLSGGAFPALFGPKHRKMSWECPEMAHLFFCTKVKWRGTLVIFSSENNFFGQFLPKLPPSPTPSRIVTWLACYISASFCPWADPAILKILRS